MFLMLGASTNYQPDAIEIKVWKKYGTQEIVFQGTIPATHYDKNDPSIQLVQGFIDNVVHAIPNEIIGGDRKPNGNQTIEYHRQAMRALLNTNAIIEQGEVDRKWINPFTFMNEPLFDDNVLKLTDLKYDKVLVVSNGDTWTDALMDWFQSMSIQYDSIPESVYYEISPFFWVPDQVIKRLMVLMYAVANGYAVVLFPDTCKEDDVIGDVVYKGMNCPYISSDWVSSQIHNDLLNYLMKSVAPGVSCFSPFTQVKTSEVARINNSNTYLRLNQTRKRTTVKARVLSSDLQDKLESFMKTWDEQKAA